MPTPLSRQLLAALVALLVVCSIGGTPVAAAAAEDAVLDGELSADFEGGDGDPERSADSGVETDGESDDAEHDDGAGDGSDGDETRWESDGDDARWESDGDDDPGGEAADDGGDGDGAETADGDGSDGESGESDAANDEEADQESNKNGKDHRHSHFYTHDNDDERGGDDSTDDDRSRYRSGDVESIGSDTVDVSEYVDGSAGGLEDDADELVGAAEDTVDTTAEAVEKTTLKISLGFIEIDLVSYSGATPGAEAVPTSGTTEIESVEGPSDLDLTGGHGAGDHEEQTVVGAGGDGGEPMPQAPDGGAVVALGAIAAVAAVRSSPFVAGGGAKVTSSTGTSLLSAMLERFRPFVLPLRYSRYDDSDPLEHEARELVFDIVNEEPGSYLSEVSEEADLPLSTTRHHIKILEREDLVSGAKLRGKRRFYPAYAEGIELAAALNDDSTAIILDAIARFGAASVSDLAEELERDPSTISHHLQRLEEDDIVTRERDGRAVVTRLSREARTALEPESTPRPGEAGEALAGGAD